VIVVRQDLRFYPYYYSMKHCIVLKIAIQRRGANHTFLSRRDLVCWWCFHSYSANFFDNHEIILCCTVFFDWMIIEKTELELIVGPSQK
jgi:hypothetical protein